MTTARQLTWTRRERGWHETTDPEGHQWRIIRATSSRWEVICDGVTYASWPATLAEGKLVAEEEADPVARERRERRRRIRRALLQRRRRTRR